MSDYNKATNFATKDSLLSGNPAKAIKGTEIDTEFNAIAGAIATKAEQGDITDAVDAAIANLSITGRIIQSLSMTHTSYSVSSGGWLPTGHVITITPTNVASKILVMVHGGDNWNHNRADLLNNQTKIYKNGVATDARSNQAGTYIYGADMSRGGVTDWTNSMILLDSPNTLSPVAYQVYVTGEFSYQGAIMVVLEIL